MFPLRDNIPSRRFPAVTLGIIFINVVVFLHELKLGRHLGEFMLEYLDGYGALFMVNVGFPLLPPPAKAEAQRDKAPADSTWEEARRELYGQPAEANTAGEFVEDYDGAKVSRLKEALIGALKDATNIRNLKPDDWITACVFGGARVSPFRMKSSNTTGNSTPPGVDFEAAEVSINKQTGTFDFSDSQMRGTIMTLRVKKSNVDAFAGGKLTLDEFWNRAGVAIYEGGPVGRSTGSFSFSGVGNGFGGRH